MLLLTENYFNMKKLKHYPGLWQTVPFSMEMFAHFEQESKLRNEEAEIERKTIKKEKKPKFKIAFGL